MRSYTRLETEFVTLYIVAENQKLSAVHLGEEDFLTNEQQENMIEDPSDDLLVECVTQLKEYFTGKRTKFDLPLEQKGTDFQMDVWRKLEDIPFGETRSYLDIAIAVERPKAVRAVGQANKANQFPIIVPCHRVIGKNKNLTGYAGTRTEIKERLLQLEGASFKAQHPK